MDVANVVVTAVGVAVAAIALVVAIKANRVAKTGNGLAQAANDTAAEALGEAQDANVIAGEANTIAERALRVAQDDLPYNWVLTVDDDGVAKVVNDCGHRALEVTVVIDRGGNVVEDAGAPIDLEPFDTMLFDLEDAIEQHFELVRQRPYKEAQFGSGYFIAGTSGKAVVTVFRAHVRWLTDQQVPRTDVVQQVVRHHMTHKGMRRIKTPDGATGSPTRRDD